jgi:hypothetical protein
MSKRWILLLGVLLLSGLAACQTQTPEATPLKPTTLPTLASTATKVVALPTPTPTATASPVPEDTAVPEGAKAMPSPTRPWQIPEIQPDDWTKGGVDAGLILVEYSDFQ